MMFGKATTTLVLGLIAINTFLVTPTTGASVRSSNPALDVPPLKDILNDYNMFLGDKMTDKARKLRDSNSTLACGESFGSFTAEDVNTLGQIFLGALLTPGTPADAIASARSLLLDAVQYDVQVVKVCMSCNEAKQLLEEGQLNSDDQFGFLNYCSEGMYGADDVMHSSLALIPMEPGTSNIVPGAMKGLMQTHGTSILTSGAPTVSFPADLGAFLAETDPSDVIGATADRIVSIIFASAGAIAIDPDYLGYGESVNMQRAYFSRYNYAQAVTTGWLATREYVSSQTEGCSALAPSTTVFGFSEGGYAATVAAFALEQVGIHILQAYPSGAPIKTMAQFGFGYQLFHPDIDILGTYPIELVQAWQMFMAFGAYSNSFGNPFLANSGTGQVLTADGYYGGDTMATNVNTWFDPPAELEYGFLAFTPVPPTSVWNADFGEAYLNAINAGGTDPCVDEFRTASIDKLCEEFIGADLSEELESATFPVFTCYSPEDMIVTIDNAPDHDANENLNAYNGIGGEIMQPTGSHGEALVYCSIAPIITLNDAGDNNPVTIEPMSCDGTESPTESSGDTDDDAAANSMSMLGFILVAMMVMIV